MVYAKLGDWRGKDVLDRDGEKIDTDAELSSFDEEGVYRHYGLTYAPPATPSGRRLGRR